MPHVKWHFACATRDAQSMKRASTCLSRRTFTLGSGALLTVAAFSSGCGGAYIAQRQLPLETGRTYVRAQLAAARLDLRFHPVSQSLQEFEAMAPLRADLAGLLPVKAPGKVQMLVRVGRTGLPAVSPRRALAAMVKT